jgi:mRNA turnover protein 4
LIYKIDKNLLIFLLNFFIYRFLFGKNKVISLAFGRGVESEYMENLHKITPHLIGNVGLLFSNKTKEEVLK